MFTLFTSGDNDKNGVNRDDESVEANLRVMSEVVGTASYWPAFFYAATFDLASCCPSSQPPLSSMTTSSPQSASKASALAGTGKQAAVNRGLNTFWASKAVYWTVKPVRPAGEKEIRKINTDLKTGVIQQLYKEINSSWLSSNSSLTGSFCFGGRGCCQVYDVEKLLWIGRRTV